MGRGSAHGARLAVGVIMTVAATLANPKEEGGGGELALHGIMKDLGDQMQIITDGISREDWTLVEKASLSVANHPQPPLMEKARILRFIGSDAAQFRAYDRETQDAATAVAEAAKSAEGTAVIAAFEQMQLSCFACHQRFRQPFMEHFYGRRQ